jgi:O-antigen/teichoic acid export membrane protein
MKKAFYQSIFITLISVFLNFGFKIFVARVIDKEILALYFTAIDIFTITLIIFVGFRSSMVVSFAKFKDDRAILNIFRVVIVIAALLSWSFVIPYLKHTIGIDINYWYLVATVLALATYTYLGNQIAMYRLYPIINSVTFLEPIFLIAWFVIAFYLSGVQGIKPLFIATIMSSLSLSLFIYFMRSKDIKTVPFSKVDLTQNMKTFMKNSAISTIEFGSGIMMMYLSVVFMLEYFSKDELGDFQVVSKPIFMYMIMLFVFPIFRFVLPELSKLLADNRLDDVRGLKNWILRYALIVSALFIVISVLYARDIIATMFDYSYHNAYIMIVHLSFFFIFVILNAYQIAFIKASGDFMSALLIRLSGLVALVVIFYGIYYLYEKSVIAVILALIGGYVMMFGISFFVERRILKKLSE